MTATKRYEFRLRWQRLGRAPTSRIMQTERGVVAKAERLLALDEEKLYDDETGAHPCRGMPDLVTLSIERREVRGWTAHRTFDVPEPDPESTDPPDDVDAGHNAFDDIPF